MLRQIRASVADLAGEQILTIKLACCFHALNFNSILTFEKVLKLILFGANVLEAFALAFLFVFGLLAVFFFNYHKLVGGNSVNTRLSEINEELKAKDTAKLLEVKPFEPIGSVTENSTEFLYTKMKTQKL